ncbi:MAG TPA: GtrA family protein [Polyangiaceae bacterium]|jgi:putative flippase GtrA
MRSTFSWKVLARHQLGAFAATALDFAIMIACVHAGLPPVAATAIGASCGAVTNFTLARHWIFPAGASGRVHRQAIRYALVSLTSLGLNTLGEYLLVDVAHLHYLLARVLVAGLVGIGWNYTMHRSWVFTQETRRAGGR